MKDNAQSGTKGYAGFSKLDLRGRLQSIAHRKGADPADFQNLSSLDKIDFSLSEQLIENSIGYFQIPLGIAVGFVIDGKEYVIPMAIEESSVIACASKTAKWIHQQGEITTEQIQKLSIGQLQIAKVNDFLTCHNVIKRHKQELMDQLNLGVAKGLWNRGGGVRDIVLRKIFRNDHYDMAVIHVYVDTCDAMGANIINQICEKLRKPIEKLTREKVNLCILSNLCDTNIVKARIKLNNIEADVADAIAEASLFANLDPYRAATNNKGALNAMDAMLIATGNDWRAVEAGIHAYAVRDGQYSSITQWKVKGKCLEGEIKVPINVGIVGGVTKLHPTARFCLKLLNVTSASELARVIAAVGLAQNLGALRALTNEGIVRGHMKLHINNLCMAVHANPEEAIVLKKKLFEVLETKKFVSEREASSILNSIRH